MIRLLTTASCSLWSRRFGALCSGLCVLFSSFSTYPHPLSCFSCSNIVRLKGGYRALQVTAFSLSPAPRPILLLTILSRVGNENSIQSRLSATRALLTLAVAVGAVLSALGWASECLPPHIQNNHITSHAQVSFTTYTTYNVNWKCAVPLLPVCSLCPSFCVYQPYYPNRPAMPTSAPRVQTSSGPRPVGPTHVYPTGSQMMMIPQQQLSFAGSPGYFIPPWTGWFFILAMKAEQFI